MNINIKVKCPSRHFRHVYFFFQWPPPLTTITNVWKISYVFCIFFLKASLLAKVMACWLNVMLCFVCESAGGSIGWRDTDRSWILSVMKEIQTNIFMWASHHQQHLVCVECILEQVPGLVWNVRLVRQACVCVRHRVFLVTSM